MGMFALETRDIEWIESNFKSWKFKDFEWTEDFFLKVIRENSNKYFVAESVVALRKVGTDKSVPVLKGLTTYPMQDVKCSTVLTIAEISGKNEADYFVSLIETPTFREKGYAIWALLACKDPLGKQSVYKYLKKRAAKICKGEVATDWYIRGFLYLVEVVEREDTDIIKLLLRICKNRNPEFEAENQYLREAEAKLGKLEVT